MAESDLAIIFADYDNIVPPQKEYSADDVEANLVLIVDSLVAEIASWSNHEIREVSFRFYGGWIGDSGVHTSRGGWLLSRLNAGRGLRSGIRVLPTMITAIAERAAYPLAGSFRTRSGRSEQKMVDTMLAVDLIYYARTTRHPLIVASDDDDVVPAALSASTNPCGGIWMLRHRDPHRGVNDMHLSDCGVKLHVLPTALRRI